MECPHHVRVPRGDGASVRLAHEGLSGEMKDDLRFGLTDGSQQFAGMTHVSFDVPDQIRQRSIWK